ncbi:MAG TPA: SAF domain-containing protein [Candidatus Dormibacteraeota bacterium]
MALLGIAAGRGDAGATAGAATPQTSVVVTTRSLPASSRLAPGDLTVEQVPASGVDAALVHTVNDVLGRRLLVPMPAHTPLERVLVGAPAANTDDASRRTVRVDVPAAHVAPDVTASTDAEVVASTDAASAAGAGSREVRVVAVCHVLQLDVVAAPASTTSAGQAIGALTAVSADGSDVAAILDCDAAAALRVLMAADFAHSLRLLAHPVGSRPVAAAVEGGA